MKGLFKKLKSNKGFTMQDVIVAMIVLVLFFGLIATTFVNIYKIQVETRQSAIVTLYAVRIMENIDEISYETICGYRDDGVSDSLADYYTNKYPFTDELKQVNASLDIDVSKYNDEDTISNVKLTITYELNNYEETLVLETIKVQEL